MPIFIARKNYSEASATYKSQINKLWMTLSNDQNEVITEYDILKTVNFNYRHIKVKPVEEDNVIMEDIREVFLKYSENVVKENEDKIVTELSNVLKQLNAATEPKTIEQRFKPEKLFLKNMRSQLLPDI